MSGSQRQSSDILQMSLVANPLGFRLVRVHRPLQPTVAILQHHHITRCASWHCLWSLPTAKAQSAPLCSISRCPLCGTPHVAPKNNWVSSTWIRSKEIFLSITRRPVLFVLHPNLCLSYAKPAGIDVSAEALLVSTCGPRREYPSLSSPLNPRGRPRGRAALRL